MDLRGKTLFVTGASRGIGKAIALRAARDGANIAVIAKTTQPHPKLPGTIDETVAAIEAAGGKALAIKTDIRFEDQIRQAIEQTVETFGGIDILVNNASALSLSGTLKTSVKVFDRMFQINARGSWLCTQGCLPLLMDAENPHVLNIAPPMSMDAKWFAGFSAYTVAKYAMSAWVLGMSAEFAEAGVAFNAIWPRTTIATAAVRNLLGGQEMVNASRKPSMMGDAAHVILCRPSRSCTGNFYLDEQVLQETGVTDFDDYAVKPGAQLQPDLYLD